MDTRSNHNALAFDVTHRLVLAIAIPMTLGFMTTPLLGLTNTAVVGRMGNAEALAGLAIGAMLFDLILGSFNFLRASTTGLTAQAYGRRDQHEQQAVFSRAMISALGCGLALLCLSPLLMAAGLRLMGAEGAIAEATGTYFSIRMLAAPAALANYAILGFVLGRGQGNIGLLLQAIINGINILLSIYLGLTLDWGVAGVAWGTMVSETVGALAGLAIVLRGFGKAARLSMVRSLFPAPAGRAFRAQPRHPDPHLRADRRLHHHDADRHQLRRGDACRQCRGDEFLPAVGLLSRWACQCRRTDHRPGDRRTLPA